MKKNIASFWEGETCEYCGGPIVAPVEDSGRATRRVTNK